MADLASTDVTLTLQALENGQTVHRVGSKEKRTVVKIAFGDGALTYPANGVPMPTTAGAYGFVRNLTDLRLIDTNDASGLVWKYDRENKKLRAWQSNNAAATASQATHSHTLHFQTSAAANAVTAAANALRTPAAAFDVAGVADSLGEGGVVTVQPAITVTKAAAEALVELGNVAVAAQVLYAEAVGW